MKNLAISTFLVLAGANALANNVQAQLSSKDLNIQGDSAANQIRIDEVSNGVRALASTARLSMAKRALRSKLTW